MPEKGHHVVSVYSVAGERLLLLEPVPIVGSIDTWIGPLETALTNAVKRNIADVIALPENFPRVQLLGEYSLQAAVVGLEVGFTKEVETCLSIGGASALQKPRRRVLTAIERLTKDVRFLQFLFCLLLLVIGLGSKED